MYVSVHCMWFISWLTVNADGRLSLLMPVDDVCVEIDGRERLSSSWKSSGLILLYLKVLIKYKRPVIISKLPKNHP